MSLYPGKQEFAEPVVPQCAALGKVRVAPTRLTIRSRSAQDLSDAAACSFELQGLKPISTRVDTSGLKPGPPKSTFRNGPRYVPHENLSFLGLGRLQLDAKKIELIFIDMGRRFRHQVLRFRRLREGDYFADRLFAGKQGRDAVEA